ncbi:hypothetical protein OAZ88_00065 [bacterium]|nr:hypothetical protein [bacterium]
MPTPRYNKYNPGKTKGFHPINKWRCDSSKHPVITSSSKYASINPKTKFSQQELAILTGLSNTLKCNEQDAVRIALYEASRSARKAHETAFNISWKSTEKGHQGRSWEGRWKLPKEEQIATTTAAQSLSIKDSEFVRLSIIWLHYGIRRNEITSIENCRIISGDDSSHQWSRDNQGKPPSEKTAALKQALQETQMLFDYFDEIKQEDSDKRREESNSMTWSTRAQIDQEVSDYEADQDKWFEDLLELETLENAKSSLAYAFSRKWNVDWDTALLIVEDDLRSKTDPKKMKPMEKLSLIESGRAKVNKPDEQYKARKREFGKRRENEFRRFDEYIYSLPKTWWAYVEARRLDRRMLGQMILILNCRTHCQETIQNLLIGQQRTFRQTVIKSQGITTLKDTRNVETKALFHCQRSTNNQPRQSDTTLRT